MRYWKNIFSFLFVIVFFVSCASQSEEIVPDYNNEFEQNTFDGLELTFAMSPYVCYEQDSLFGDIAKARVAEIEEKYDVDIVFDENESLVSNLFYSISSGIKPCDVMLSDSFELYNQMRANLLFPVDNMPEPLVYTNTEKWGGIIADENGLTSRANVYAGGDAVTGAATVILAMGAGKTAASAIDEQLKNK